MVATADAALAHHTKLPAKRLKEMQADLQALPALPNVVQALDLGERFMLLDAIAHLARGNVDVLTDHGTDGKPVDVLSCHRRTRPSIGTCLCEWATSGTTASNRPPRSPIGAAQGCHRCVGRRVVEAVGKDQVSTPVCLGLDRESCGRCQFKPADWRKPGGAACPRFADADGAATASRIVRADGHCGTRRWLRIAPIMVSTRKNSIRSFPNISLRFPRIVSAPMARRFAIAARGARTCCGASAPTAWTTAAITATTRPRATTSSSGPRRKALDETICAARSSEIGISRRTTLISDASEVYLAFADAIFGL